MDTTRKLQLAAYNNAVWCDTVCRSHNVPGEFHKTFWVNWHQTPIYYPNIVMLSPTTNLKQSALMPLLTTRKDYIISLKDSFAALDLTSFGFHQLFQAQWIFRQAPRMHHLPRQETTDLQWKRIASEKALLQWEEAWSQTALPVNRIFLPELLHNADICIIAAYKDNQIVAGAIANRTSEVIGLSNIFTPEKEAERYWKGILDMITASYPALPIVGYEQAENLQTASRTGFTPLGPLRVWIKEKSNSGSL